MHFEYNIAHEIFNVILAFIWIAFLLLVLKPKHGIFLTVVCFVSVQTVSLFLCMIPPASWFLFRFFWGIGVITACTFWLFRDKWTRILLCVGMIFINIPPCEMLTFLIARTSFGDIDSVMTLPAVDQFGCYAVYLAIYCLLLWFCTLLLNRYTDQLSTRELLLYLAFPLSQSFLVGLNHIAANRMMATQLTILRFVTVIICFASDVGLYLSIRGMAQRARLKALNAQLSEQIENQKEHYAALTAQYENIRTLRHDIANHMHTVQVLLENGEAEEAAKYAGELSPRHRFHSSLGGCENPIVDAFLFSRINEAQEKGIPIEAHVALPTELSIANADLVSAFGNLLDNAEEACLQTAPEKRFIRILAGVKDGICSIRMENSMPEEAKHAARIAGLERGVGTHILNGLAEQYGGTFASGAKGECFSALLTLQV